MSEEYNKMKKHNINKMFFVASSILGLLITMVILFVERSVEYNFIYLIPMSYTLILILFSKIFLKPFYKYGPLFFIAQGFIFIRYVLTPLSMVMVDNEFVTGPSPKLYEMNMSIALMVYELLFVFIGIYIAVSRKKEEKISTFNNRDILLENKLVIGLVTIVFGIILINFPNSIIPHQLLFVDETFTNADFDTGLDGAVSIMSMLFKCMAFLLLVSFIRKNIKNNLLNFSFAFLTLILFMASFTGTNRWTLIFMGLAGLIIIDRLYPRYKRFLRISSISILTASIISISMSNFYWVLQGSQAPIRDILEHMSTQFQVYFSGPRPVAQSLNIKEYFPNISITTFLNDFLGSVPYVSNFIDQTDRINYYYNVYNYRKTPTLIMPLVGIGYTYFGFLLAPIFTIAAQLMIIKLDKLSQSEMKIEFVFIYLYLGLRLTMSMGLSTQSLFTSFLIPTIPLFLVCALNSKIVFSKKKTYSVSRGMI